MNIIFDIATNGLQQADVARQVLQISTGAFFALSGGNKLFNAGRHATLVDELKRDNIPCVQFMQWWVPGWELVAGSMVALNVAHAFFAAVLLILMAVALLCTAKRSVDAYKPINAADRIDDYLYLPEMLYAIMLLAIILM